MKQMRQLDLEPWLLVGRLLNVILVSTNRTVE